jgi:hypothetical protein
MILPLLCHSDKERSDEEESAFLASQKADFSHQKRVLRNDKS